MNNAVYLQLREAVVRRDRRNLIVAVPDLGNERIVLADPTGNVELLLELLARGRRTRAAIIREFTCKREGAEAPAVAAALDALEQLGLIVTSSSGPAQAEEGRARLRADSEAAPGWRSPTGLPCSGTFCVPPSGARP